jgi:AcrR family transcriptional regulator
MKAQSTSRAGERRNRRRQEILNAASALFSQHGYENVTLRAIAEELGYAHAALYRYFPDKSSLLAEICRETFDLLTAEVDRLQTPDKNPEQRLFDTSRGFVRFGLTHPQHFRIVFFGPENRGGVRAGEYIEEIGKPLFERLVKIFVECSEAAGLRTSNRLLDAHTWWASLFGVTQVLITSGPVPSLSAHDEIVERLLHVLWGGLKALSLD